MSKDFGIRAYNGEGCGRRGSGLKTACLGLTV